MNKKLSTFLFIIAGTILNIFLMILCIAGLWAGSNAILNSLGQQLSSPILIAIIFGGMVLAFFIYSKIMKFVQKKFDLEKHLEPIFKTKRR